MKLKGLVQDHGHHLGAEVHHLQQEVQLFALFSQALVKDVVAFRVRVEVVQLGLVSRAQLLEEWGNAHGCLCPVQHLLKVALPNFARCLCGVVQQVAATVVVIGFAFIVV